MPSSRFAVPGSGCLHSGLHSTKGIDEPGRRLVGVKGNSPFESDAGRKKLADLGVTDAIVGFRNVYDQDTMPLQKKIEALRLYADHIIAKSEAA